MSSDGLIKLTIISILSNTIYALHHEVIENNTLVIPSENCKSIGAPSETTLDFSLIEKNCYDIEYRNGLKILESFHTIDPNLFQNLSSIESLQANYLNFTEIHLRSFNLRNIDLSRNKIESVKLVVYDVLSSLNLSYNKLVKISLIPRKRDRSILEILNLTHNNLKEFDSTSRFTNLRILDLSWNKIEKIPEKIFTRLKKLKRINLSHNKIKTLPNYLFTYQGLLEYLDLSHNTIITISRLLAQPVLNLEVIHLRGNKIEISKNDMIDIMKNFVKLNEITVNHEKFECTPELIEKIRDSLPESSCLNLPNSKKICCSSEERVLKRRSISNSHFHATINNKKMAHNVSSLASNTTRKNVEKQVIPDEFFDKLHHLNMKNLNTTLNATMERIDLGVSELQKQYSNIISKLNSEMKIVNSKLNNLNETFNDIFLEISNLNTDISDNVNPKNLDSVEKNYENVIYLLTLCIFLLLISVFLTILRIVISLRKSRVPKEFTMGLLNMGNIDH